MPAGTQITQRVNVVAHQQVGPLGSWVEEEEKRTPSIY